MSDEPLTEPSDVLVPDTTPDAGAPAETEYLVGLFLATPEEGGDRELELKLTGAEIRRLLKQETQWVKMPEKPYMANGFHQPHTHPMGLTRYINVLNQVQEIRIYGDWTPGED